MVEINKKYVGLVACIVAIVCTVMLCIGIFAKADINDEKIEVKYEDDYYYNSEVIDVDNPIIQDIYEKYENYDNGYFDLVIDGEKLSYNIEGEDIQKIDSISSALYMYADESMEGNELLYLGYKDDCTYDSASGKAVSQFDCKWLILNNTQPLAMYNQYEEDGIKKFYTPAYINNEEYASNILVSVDSSNVIKVLGKVIDKDIEGNPLEQVQIEELEGGDIICPAYVNYDYSIVSMVDYIMEAKEVYNDNTYVYGTEFNLSYESLPESSYLYSMKANYKDDESTDEKEDGYGYFTKPKLVAIKDDNIVSIEDSSYEDIETIHEKLLDGYKYVRTFDFLKQVWKHKKANTKEELYQAFEHKIDGVQKGYISTWNSLTINKALRTDNVSSLEAEDQLTITTLDAMCKKISSENNYLMLRKVAADYLTSVFGIKGLNGDALTNDMVKAYTEEEKLELEKNLQSIVGKTMVEKGFMSASMIPYANIIGGRTVEIIIKVPAGTQYYVSHNVVESEAIFPTNTELVIESIKYNNKGKYIMVAKVQQNK